MSGADESLRHALGYAGLGLSILALCSVVFSLPWQVTFWVVIIAVLFGPGAPLMLLQRRVPTVKCVVMGMGVDVALVLLVAQALVMFHIWQPKYAVIAILAASGIASACLLGQSVMSRTGVRDA
jgi:hypothetical protein